MQITTTYRVMIYIYHNSDQLNSYSLVVALPRSMIDPLAYINVLLRIPDVCYQPLNDKITSPLIVPYIQLNKMYNVGLVMFKIQLCA